MSISGSDKKKSYGGWLGILQQAATGANINQIRGINNNGALGNGIPAHVTNVTSSCATASTGTTTTVTITFRRDPTDPAFGGVNVFVKGYQANPAPVQMTSSVESPCQFILNNTGEPISIIVQAYGNGGAAPLNTAPTTGVSLPKSTNGGVSTTTNTQLTFGAQSANTFYAGPSSGSAAAPTFRTQVPADVPDITSAGAGFLHSFYGTPYPATGSAGQFCLSVGGVDTANAVNALQIVIPFKMTVRKVTVGIAAAIASSHVMAAIYDSTGTTKVLDAGTNAFDSGSVGVKTVTLSTPVTLNPGTYWMAVSCTSINVTSQACYTVDYGTTTTNHWSRLLGTNVTRLGRAANDSSSGTMPTSLGSISAFTATAPFNLAAFLLES